LAKNIGYEVFCTEIFQSSINLTMKFYGNILSMVFSHMRDKTLLSLKTKSEMRLTCTSIPFHSMYGATAPSGPWPPSKRASTRPCFQLLSSILLLLTAVMNPSEPRLPIWFLVFPLVLCCRRFHLKPFLGSSLPPFLLYGPPTLFFWFLYLPRCLDRYIGCTVHYSNNVRTFQVPKINSFSLYPSRRLFVELFRGIFEVFVT